MTRRAGPATLDVMTTKSLLLTKFGGSVSADVDAPADDVFALLTDTSRVGGADAGGGRPVAEPLHRGDL
jgi:hypothetical protein